MPTATEREKEALFQVCAAQDLWRGGCDCDVDRLCCPACDFKLTADMHAAVLAYGRAVREADKEAALGETPPTDRPGVSDCESSRRVGRWEAFHAIEKLEQK